MTESIFVETVKVRLSVAESTDGVLITRTPAELVSEDPVSCCRLTAVPKTFVTPSPATTLISPVVNAGKFVIESVTSVPPTTKPSEGMTMSIVGFDMDPSLMQYAGSHSIFGLPSIIW